MSNGTPEVKQLKLGQVAGIVVSEIAPTRKNVIWAKPLDNTGNNWELFVYKEGAWVMLKTPIVGEILYTGLTFAQAQAQLGADGVNWYLADGQNCAGTKYADLGYTNVPNLSPGPNSAILIKVN